MASAHESSCAEAMLKVLGWGILIIFIIGLLVVLGFFKLIF
jgi:hypothetical protein